MGTSAQSIVESAPAVFFPAALGPYRVDDYFSLPDEPRVELIRGRYHLSPAPIALHQIVSMELSAWLHAIAKRTGGLGLAAPCDVVLSDDTVVQPDLLYFTRARRPAIGARFEAAPDLAIEILSPTHHKRDKVMKLGVYADSNVAEYWIVDPAEKSFEFLVLVDGKYQVQAIAAPTYQSPSFAELSINLPDFWKEIDRQIGDAS